MNRWLALVLFLLFGGLAARAQERPNVLFLLADDQRADALGAAGNPYVRTPHLDRLAGEGFRFRRAYIMGGDRPAVCAPSRAMLLSGRSLFRVGADLDTVVTFPERLREEGYVTFGTGKWHQSRASFRKSFTEGRRVFFGGMADHSATPVRDMQPDGGFSEPSAEGFSTTLFADAAVDFIERRAASGDRAPFLAYVAFTAPHDPRTPPDEYLAAYARGTLPLPPAFMPVHPFDLGRLAIRDEQLAPWPRTPEVVRAQLAEYYGLVTHMDHEIGRILEALDRTGVAANTIVVFAADNGLAMGSHGLLGKQNLYEHAVRVPLVVAGPGIPAGESDALVYLHDLFPTIVALTGAPLPPGVDGEDLAPVWRGERPRVRESLFTAYEDLHRAVRDDRWKLIRYPKLHHTQLFDLESDPYELQNLAGDPAHAERVGRMMRLLASWQRRTGDPAPLTAPTRAPMEFDYDAIERRPDRHQPAIIREKYFEP